MWVLPVLVSQQNHDDFIVAVREKGCAFQMLVDVFLLDLHDLKFLLAILASLGFLAVWFLFYLLGFLIMVVFVPVTCSACLPQQWTFIGCFPRYSKE